MKARWLVSSLAATLLTVACQTTSAGDQRQQDATPGNINGQAPAPNSISALVAQRPTFSPGDTFWFKNNRSKRYRHTYVGVENGNHVFVSESGSHIIYNSDMASIEFTGSRSRRFVPHSGFLKFPLTEDSSWRHTYTIHYANGEKVKRTRKCRVSSFEEVTVEAGAFDAFIIRCNNQRHDRQRPARERYAFAPAVGRVIDYYSREFREEISLTKFEKVPRDE